jgi:hypothetical protein
VLPCIATLLASGLYTETLEVLEDLTETPQSEFVDVVDWFLVVAFPETAEMVHAYYNDEEGSAPLRAWFAADELAQIDTLLCNELVAAEAV